MKAWATIGLGAAVLFGTMLAFGKNNRFLGDKAKKGDTAFVPLSALANATQPEIAAAAKLAADTGAASVGILVESETADTLTGTVAKLASPMTTNDVPAPIAAQIGRLTVKRADVSSIVRDGKVVS